MKIFREIKRAVKNTGRFLRNKTVLGISFLTPRDKNKWLFGSNMGFAANAKYLFIYLIEHPQEKITVCWMTENQAEYDLISSLGLPVVKPWSLKGLRYSLTAGCYLYNSYLTDLNIHAAGRAKKLNLWHGVGIKSIERGISVGPLYELFNHSSLWTKLKKQNIRFFIKPDLFLSTSPMMTAHFSRCFGISSDRCIESSYPRNQILKADKDEVCRFVNRYESADMCDVVSLMEHFDHTIIYMPTMRDSSKNFIQDLWDFDAVNAALKEVNALLLLKLHSATYIDVDIEAYSNIVLLTNSADVYPLMALSDCLITDYSSVYYDYITMPGKRTWLLIPDYDDFMAHDRDLAFPYDENTGEKKIYSMQELTECIKGLNAPVPERSASTQDVIDRFWTHGEHSSHDLVELIKGRL